MKFCEKCGTQVSDNAAFCPGCGVKLSGELISNDEQKAPVQQTVTPSEETAAEIKLPKMSFSDIMSGNVPKLASIVVFIVSICCWISKAFENREYFGNRMDFMDSGYGWVIYVLFPLVATVASVMGILWLLNSIEGVKKYMKQSSFLTAISMIKMPDTLCMTVVFIESAIMIILKLYFGEDPSIWDMGDFEYVLWAFEESFRDIISPCFWLSLIMMILGVVKKGSSTQK